LHKACPPSLVKFVSYV